MLNRREFTGLCMLTLSGCRKFFPEDTQRDKLIKNLQSLSRKTLDYEQEKGYVYNVNVDGEEVEVNVSKTYFYTHGNKLKYTVGKTSVRVYKGDKIKIRSCGVFIDEPNRILKAQELTDKVIKAALQENSTIREKALKQSEKDLD